MSSSKNGGLSVCPCCDHTSLEHNGAYMTCGTCGLAITTQALLRAVRHTQESTLFDSTGVRSTQLMCVTKNPDSRRRMQELREA